MNTDVSIPDALYDRAEQLARRLQTSRGELYAEALREYLERHDDDAATDALNRVFEVVDSRPDPDIATQARRVLERTEW